MSDLLNDDPTADDLGKIEDEMDDLEESARELLDDIEVRRSEVLERAM